MDVSVKWQQRLTFKGTAETGFSVPLGADSSVGGDNDGFRPMELIATGLAGCTAMDVISILLKKREDVTDFEVRAHLERAEQHPKVFTSAVIEYHVVGHELSENSLLRAIELSAEIYCPAQAMFDRLIPVELHYRIYEDLGNGERVLVKSGAYQKSTSRV